MTQPLRLLKRLFTGKQLVVTLVVLLGMGVLARLGIWQLDRLEQRRARNAELRAALESPPFVLTPDALPDDPEMLKDREVTVSGRYDFSQQGILRLQSWQGRPGVHLITPLVLADGETAVLVDRGWLPDEEATPEDWSAYDQAGPVTVNGYISLSQTLSRRPAATPVPGDRAWYRIDVAVLENQMPYDLLPVYVKQAPPPSGNETLPFRPEREIDLSEGPHLGYAIQWFLFSLILGVIYVFYTNKQMAQRDSSSAVAD